uniref:uncharacterized protein LOC120334858 n=1 Tax=Styela clava TaxID=7725 RepID=UPI00193A07EB|nr:uncharacterized protein LOC120334858 [Styela clava]
MISGRINTLVLLAIFTFTTNHCIAAAVVNSASSASTSDNKTISETVETGWTAEDMPDPRYCPECCGISEPGLICDPDGIFKNRAFGGGPEAANKLNRDLHTAANKSVCPCMNGKCYTWNVVIFVAVVNKIKNPDNKRKNELIGDFAKQLQEHWWKANDTECQQEIIIALSLGDGAITTEIGDDILRAKMMKYDDVVLIGGVSQDLHSSFDLYSHVQFLVKTYAMYVNHPPETTTLSASSNQTGTISIAKSPRESGTLPAGIIALIVIAVIVFIAAIGLSVVLPFCLNYKSCFRKK